MDGEAIYFLDAGALAPGDRDAWLAAAPGFLDEGERARLARYIPPEKKVELLLGRVLVKTVLEVCHGVPSPHIAAADDDAKPALKGRPAGPFFNLSHSKGALALIVSPAREVGIDLERIRAVSDSLARGTMHEDERAAIREDADFFRLWTAKEAYMKLVGSGLKIPPLRLRVDLGRSLVRDLESADEISYCWERRGDWVASWMARPFDSGLAPRALRSG